MSIGYKYKSEESTALMVKVFFIQLLNTAFILMFANADFENTPLHFLPINNNDPDFTSKWYIYVGDSLIKTQIINAVFP